MLAGALIVGFVYRRMASGADQKCGSPGRKWFVMTLAAENYQANAVVKLFRLAGYERARFRRATDRPVRAQLRMSLFGGCSASPSSPS
ncbi:MAG: hypothetical protein R2710_13930 [Acidimicrobiales bacterium]